MKGRILALAALLALGGCVAQQPQPESPPPGSQSGGNSAGATRQPNKPAPRTAITPSPSGSSAKSRSHTQFAPPPGGTGRWDASLGVYVIQGQKDLYYRQRTYYHWADGWYWGVSPNGPWTATDASGVPPGLNRRYAQ